MEHGFVTSGVSLTWRKRKKNVTLTHSLIRKKANLFFRITHLEEPLRKEIYVETAKKLLLIMKRVCVKKPL